MKLAARLACATFCVWAGTAHAVTCTVSATALAFGNYNALSGPAALSTGSITVTCNDGSSASYSIALGPGASTDYSARQLNSGASLLSYQLFTDAAHTLVWGDGTGTTHVVSDSLNLPGHRVYTVYGRIPAGQPAPPGSYGDAIIVTVIY